MNSDPACGTVIQYCTRVPVAVGAPPACPARAQRRADHRLGLPRARLGLPLLLVELVELDGAELEEPL